jgi:hypothetical protein
MSDSAEPALEEIRPVIEGQRERIPFIAYILGALWLVLPAIQYIGATERTRMAINPEYTSGLFAALDLSPWYVALVGGTALYIAISFIRRRNGAGDSIEL